MPDRARPRPPGFPWHFWLAVLTVAALLYSANYLFPPSFQLSPVKLTFSGDQCVAGFDATNHARTSAARHLRVTVFLVRHGKFIRPPLTPLGHRDMALTLAGSETRHIQCTFTATGAFTPNAAEVTILSDAPVSPAANSRSASSASAASSF